MFAVKLASLDRDVPNCLRESLFAEVDMVHSTFGRVVACVAAATRYPQELLTADADLENDLGIDSVKNLEIVLLLAEEFGIDLASERRDPQVRTLGQVAAWIERLLSPVVLTTGAAPNPLTTRLDSAVSWQHERLRPTLPLPAAKPLANVPPAHHLTAVSSVSGSRQRESATISSVTPNRTLADRVALVTGSGRGVGRTIARVLASRGAHVIVNSFHSREQGEQTTAEIIAEGGQASHFWGSIAHPEHVERIFQQIERDFGRLDILVCNASDGRIGSFLELSPADWERAFSTNVTGHYQCAVRAAHLMQAAGGAIVTMSAVGSDRYISGLGSQGVVKAAVESLTRYLACELGRWGIRVNCVVGGPVYGELLTKFPEAQATRRHWEAMVPDGELCSPLDLAHTIGFLVSDEARGINGAIWSVDHGFSATADGRPAKLATSKPAHVSLA